ncbi:MAG: ABC-type sugar transport system, ATPase component [Conexibacter sp.]|nr:ABC-type sugar transport system, ATPase component [Conexibacter sp.]
MSGAPPSLVEARGIGKSFNGVPVLREVDFDLRAGEVHALLGGNGAGKSTLMKILEGVYARDDGEILIDGVPVALGTPAAARAHGIAMIFQEFSLVPTLTVAQNVYLARETRTAAGLIDDRASERRATEVLREMGVELDVRRTVAGLPTASWQLVEIAKALSQDARVLIMDEPTASLSTTEVEALFSIIEGLKQRGIAIVYITHRLEEVLRVADRVTVLRDGRVVGTEQREQLDLERLIELIVGREVQRSMERTGRPRDPGATPLLSLRGVSSAEGVRDMSFDVHPGEVVGLAGLMGSGRSELARALFGIDRITSGTVCVDGAPVRIRKPGDAIAHGIVLVPEDRRTQGLVLDHSVRENLTVTLLRQLSRRGTLDRHATTQAAEREIARLDIRGARLLGMPVRRLSGGNQQKVVLGKWLATEPRLLILDEPTAGVDIATKTDIVALAHELADQGRSVLVISSEFAELLALADRIVVLRDGAVERELARSEVTDEPHLHRLVQERVAA